jgi:nucleoside-diphosphate-sugar epimerase
LRVVAEQSVDRPTVLVTGASGFVGTALVKRLLSDSQFLVRASSRRRLPVLDGIDSVVVPDLAPDTDWRKTVQGADVVVHLAARVHIMRETDADALTAFRRINTAATENLARQAADAGVQRFVYLSSVKVNGEQTAAGRPFTEEDTPCPVDPYGVSKHEAERALRDVARETGLEVVIIRPPLVYGPGVKANFRQMMWWLHRGVPLPLGAVHNQRSLVGLDNLVDLIATCLRHPSATNQTFFVSDGEDLSTPQLLRRLADALGRPARLVPVPAPLLLLGLGLLNKRDIAERLLGSLQIDISHARKLLNWRPPFSADECLRRTALDYLESRRSATQTRH